jgi:hypothetical protein
MKNIVYAYDTRTRGGQAADASDQPFTSAVTQTRPKGFASIRTLRASLLGMGPRAGPGFCPSGPIQTRGREMGCPVGDALRPYSTHGMSRDPCPS